MNIQIWGGTDEKTRVGPEVRRWISLMALPALRDAEGDVQNWRRSPLRPLLEALQIDPDRLETIAKSLTKATKELLSEKPIAKLGDEISERISEMVGGIHGVEATLGLAPTGADQLLRSIRLFVDGDKTRQLSEGSLGSANIIFLALLMQALDARRSASEIVSTILAIEEPEAHLHPQVQRLLFRYFLHRQHPVIVTTHSPNVASVAPVESLVLLRKNPKGYSVGCATSEIGSRAPELSDDHETFSAFIADCAKGKPLAIHSLQDFARDGRVKGRTVLTTLHSSKGRQFDAVILPGLVEGILPRRPWNRDTRSYGEPPPPVLSEDRRLFYVGFTRARKVVFLVFEDSFSNDRGYAVSLGTSRFVKEIHKRLHS